MFSGAYAGKRVFVTGHTGFKGSWLVHWLLDLGAEVAGYSLYIPSQPSNFEALELEGRMRRHYTGDIRDYDRLAAAMREFQPEIVFHLAAQPIVMASYADPKLTFETNVGGTVNILEAMRRETCVKTAVVITSDKCYENVEWEYGYREFDQLGGKDPYSASKACAEVVFSAYARSFFTASGAARMSTARAGNVIGGGDWAKDRIVPDCIRAWAGGKAAMLRNPFATRPWQHVLEPLSGYLWLGARLGADAPGLVNEAFNFGPPADGNYPVEALVAEMGKTWSGAAWETPPGLEKKEKEANLLKLCCDKALNRLQWTATLDFGESVKMTAEWYYNYYRGRVSARDCTSAQIADFVQRARGKGLAWAK